MFFFGLKLLDDKESLFWTGQKNDLVLKNLLALDRETDTPYHLRIPFLAGVTDRNEYLEALEKFCRQLNRASSLDFLPSNPEAGAKYAACGKTFDPGFDVEKKAVLPGWFDPGFPVRLLSAGQIS